MNDVFVHNFIKDKRTINITERTFVHNFERTLPERSLLAVDFH